MSSPDMRRLNLKMKRHEEQMGINVGSIIMFMVVMGILGIIVAALFG